MHDAYEVRTNYGYGMSASQQTPQQILGPCIGCSSSSRQKKLSDSKKFASAATSMAAIYMLMIFPVSRWRSHSAYLTTCRGIWTLLDGISPVHQFDHTIEKPPADNPMFFFHKARVAASDEPGAMSLDSIVGRFLAGCNRAILKIDIEGDEWAVFHAVSTATLARFSQIVCEFHGLQLAGDPNWSEHFLAVLKKLRSLFEVVHVHGNNRQPFINLGNLVLPTLLEVTFANRHDYQFAETDEIFPTALDRPNLQQVPEMRLGCFKF